MRVSPALIPVTEALRSRSRPRSRSPDATVRGSARALVQACPACGGPVMRVLRTANDKRRWDSDAWRRYRCRDAMCNWQGLLEMHRRRATRRRQGVLPRLARLARALLWLLLAALLATAGMAALRHMLQP